ncbi:hypothetical protein J3R82DRAFT_8961 [Butyriboletus roseoflavus]|nr:hypothetical protein J3R82DRAFT_8961 [Butyriboletus roseoflavus]
MGFKQWTGDDLKVLMKQLRILCPPRWCAHCTVFWNSVILSTCHVISESALEKIKSAASTVSPLPHNIHGGEQSCGLYILTTTPTCSKALPTSHSVFLVLQMVCVQSITENKHIKVVKEPWCQSSKYQPLGQMLLTNQQLE